MSKDCISREGTLKALREIVREENHLEPPIYEAIDIIKTIPEMPDVAEVVRCKDCKHHEELLNNNDENVLCWVHDIDVIVDRNGYCNYGEREEQEHD